LWTHDGKAWETLDLPKKADEMKQILGATIFYDGSDQRLHLAGMFRISGEGIMTSDYELKDVTIKDTWTQGSLAGFEWDSPIDLFQILSVSFRERWIFSPVYQDWAGIRSYSARIYITPVRT
jgi:hypothetical protein